MVRQSRKKHAQRVVQCPANRYLVQFRIQAVAFRPCESSSHQPGAKDDHAWEVRVYQNFDRAQDLIAQGMDSDRRDQMLWDEACREQDTIGVRLHKQFYLCDTCIHSFDSHIGAQGFTLVCIVAQMTGGAFLLVSNRETEETSIISPFPVDLPEQDMLRKIREMPSFKVNLKGEEG